MIYKSAAYRELCPERGRTMERDRMADSEATGSQAGNTDDLPSMKVRERRLVEDSDKYGDYTGVRIVYEDGSWEEFVGPRAGSALPTADDVRGILPTQAEVDRYEKG